MRTSSEDGPRLLPSSIGRDEILAYAYLLNPKNRVQGTVTIPGSPESLRVVTARPVLVGGASY